MERMAEQPAHGVDICRLTEEPHVASGHLPQVIEAAELLGFVTIRAGDIKLTPLGETFADAPIAARKEIFGSRLRRLPLVTWLLDLLRAGGNRQIKFEVAETTLSLEFPRAEAARQVATIINWGRYAEIPPHDANSEVIPLEPEGGARPQ